MTGPGTLRFAAVILLVLALPLCLAALATTAGLLRLPYELWLVEQRLPLLFRAHMVSAGLALLLVPCAITCHGRNVHKLVGRTAATLVLVGGLTALPVALASEGHWLARAGFAVQGLAWVALLGAAVHAIRRGDRVRHMWLMLGVAAIASGALWLRLASWTAAHWPDAFEAAYATAAWLSWLLPLAGIALAARHASRAPAPTSASRAPTRIASVRP